MLGVVRELIPAQNSSSEQNLHSGVIIDFDDAVPRLKLVLLDVLGKGSFGTVYRATCDKFQNCAVKIVSGRLQRLQAEIDVLRKVGRNGLIAALEFAALSADSATAVLGMELCVPLTLHDFLLTHSLPSMRDLLFVAHQVVSAVAAVHENNCVHRDVKLQNFVFDREGNLKLIDFGLAAPSLEPEPGDVVAGTVSFMAPEMARNALSQTNRVSVGAASDVWSTGIVLFSILTRQNPYRCSSEGEQPLTKELLPFVANGSWSWPIGVQFDPSVTHLIECLLQPNAKARPSLSDVLRKSLWRKRGKQPPMEIQAFIGADGACTPSVTPLRDLDRNGKESSKAAAVVAPHRPEKPMMTLQQMCSLERAARDLLYGILELQHSQLRSLVKLKVEEDQERYNVAWLAENQMQYAAHPHRLKKVSKMPRGYHNGIICDGCSMEVEATGDNQKIVFCHCSCGMDLCLACSEKYNSRYTCVCGATLGNRIAFDQHQRSTGCTKRKRDCERICLSDVKLGAVPNWNAFSSLGAERQQPQQQQQMSDAEIDFVLNGDWVRRFRFVYDGSDEAPVAFAYSVQPGRTGVFFLWSAARIHSAVLSVFEGKVFCVETLQVGEEHDVCCLLSCKEARQRIPNEFSMMHKIAVDDANLLKSQRTPGSFSFLPRSEKDALHCVDADYVFLRWLKADSATDMIAVSLSNGCVQILAKTFELRWWDETRKYLVRSDGQCGIINEGTFCHMKEVNRLLHEPLVRI